MAADAKLGRGAYLAAGGGIKDYGLAASKGMTAIGKDIGGRVSKELGERRDEFQEFIDWEMSREPGLSPENYNKRFEELMELKPQYMYGDSLSRANIMRDMNQMKAQETLMNDALKSLANSGNNKVDGLSSVWMDSAEGQSIAKAAKDGKWTWMDGQYKLAVDLNGETKYYTAGDIRDRERRFTFDRQSKNVFDANMQNLLDQAKNSDPYNYVEFPLEDQRSRISNIVNSGSVQSMALTDKLIPGQVFRTNLINKLQENKYSDYGIPDSIISQIDPNEDGNDTMIDENDAITIADALIYNNEDLLPEYLTGYLLEHARRNWNATQIRNKKLNQTPSGDYYTTPQQPSPSSNVYEGEDKIYNLDATSDDEPMHFSSYDYKVINGEWHFRKKGQSGKFQPFSKFKNKGVDKAEALNKKYPNAITMSGNDTYEGGDIKF